MLADPEAPAEGVGAQAIHCQRYQPFTIQAQQRGGIARQQAAHGLQQAPIALLVGQIAGQVADQGSKAVSNGFVVIKTPVGRYDYTPG